MFSRVDPTRMKRLGNSIEPHEEAEGRNYSGKAGQDHDQERKERGSSFRPDSGRKGSCRVFGIKGKGTLDKRRDTCTRGHTFL